MTPGFTAPSIDWAHLAPVVIVLGAGVVGVLIEAFVPQRARRTIQLTLALIATAAATAAAGILLAGALDDGGTEVLGGAMLLDGPALFLQATVAVLALISLLVIAARGGGEDAFAPQAGAVPGSEYEQLATRKGLVQTEVYPLTLFATGGMMIFPAAGDLLTLFIALEVLSLPLYLLAGTARRRRLLSQEASMKYFLLGAFASGLMLFGVALLYGFAGSVRLSDIGAAAVDQVGMDGLLLVGTVLLLVGLLFKVGAVPFHSWTPDVYQGAPTPITGFMAACTKVAAFGALLRVVYVMAPGLEWDLQAGMWAVAILTMVVGTVIAIVQTDMKRMLAYSSIAHAGFVLTGVIALNEQGIAGTIFYLLAYGATTIGAFAVVSVVRERSSVLVETAGGETGTEPGGGGIVGEATHLSQWAGLGRRSPLLAVTYAFLLFAFAGIPLTSGFTGKFAVFGAAVSAGATPLVVIGVLASAAAAFFYVRIVVLMFFTEPPQDQPEAVVVASSPLATTTIAVTALITLLLGVLPQPILTLVTEAAQFLP